MRSLHLQVGRVQHSRPNTRQVCRNTSECTRQKLKPCAGTVATMFARQCNLTNHAKYCKGMGMNTCECRRTISAGNMARHKRENCPLKAPRKPLKRFDSQRTACPDCGVLITSSNLSRHRNERTQKIFFGKGRKA